MRRTWLWLCVLASWPAPGAAQDYEAERRELVQEIARDFRDTSGHTGREDASEAMLAAMLRVPRHEFVPDEVRRYAYENRPLPIGHGQTISQPYIVAIMTDLLDVGPGDTVLEIGTGSGYQAAVLAAIVGRVYTIEIVGPLAASARERLARLGYDNVEVRPGDGYDGWEDHAPYDAIVVTAAASHIPPPLVRQLKAGGRMVIPVGDRFLTQQLVLVEKDETGGVRTRQLLPVQFVPLTGGH